jgi:hypothetical protein
MSDDLGAYHSAIQRFRSGGIAIAALPLVLGVALLLAGERVPALVAIMVAVIALFLILWATHCAEEVLGLQSQRPGK